MKAHSCSKTRDPHSVRTLEPWRGQGHKVDGKRCLCHGHCGDCGEAVVTCRLGRLHHVSAYAKR